MKTTNNNGDGKRFPKVTTPSDPHYRNLVDNAVIGIIDVTLDGKIIYANQAAAKMVGYESPEAARKVSAISLWNDPKQREVFISKLYEDGCVNNFEIEYITRTGKIITGLSSATLHGDVISSMVIDISERAEARSMLEQSDSRLRRAAEISKTGNWDLDFLTDDLFWSDEVYRIFGLPVTDSPPRYEKFLECVVPADREYVDRTWQAAICGEPYDIEHRIQVGAKVKWVREKAELDFDAAGRPVSAAGIVQDITESKKADEALRESREKLIKAEQLAHMGFLEWNMKSNQIELSNEVCGIYGLAQGIPQSFDQILALVHADDRDLVKRNLDMAVQDIHEFNMDHRIVRSDNKVIWVHARAELKYDKDGNPLSLMGTVVDITERKRAEEAERILAERLRQVTENAQEWVWEVDADGLYTYSSSVVKNILGYTPEEIVGKKHFYDFFDPEERETYKKAALGVFREKQPFVSFVNLNIHKKGAKVWLSCSGMPILDENGELRGYRGSDTDITERKKAEEKLLISDEIITNLTEGVYLVRAEDGTLAFTNPAFDRMFGYQAGELVGQHISVVNAPTDKDPEETAREIIEELENSGNWRGEILNLKKDGAKFWCYVNISNFDHPEYGKVYVCVHTDLSERKKAEEKLLLSGEVIANVTEAVNVIRAEDGTLVFTNPAFDRMFGYQSNELAGEHISVLNAPTDQLPEETAGEIIEAVIETGNWHGEMLNRRKDGSNFWCYANVSSFDHPEYGKVLVNVRADITDRMRAEELLKESEARFKMIYEYAPVMIDAFDDNGRCIMWNKECERVFGWTAEEIFAHENPIELFYPDSQIQQNVIETVTQTPDGTFREWNPLRKDGSETTCLWANFTLPDGRIVSLGHDITERKKAEEKVEEYQGRLKSLASQLTLAEEQERRRLAADLHDHIGQTLALTRLQLATARKGLPKDEKRDARFDEISRALLQAIQDTRNLIFELSSPSLNELGLGAAIKEWVEEQVEGKHGLQAEFLDDAQDVELSDDLRAILYRNVRELLANVIKHAKAKSVSVSLEGTANYLTVSIQDDGEGFDPDMALQRTKFEGGFGLFSIQERMSDLGGMLEIVSQPGKGCKAILQAPIVAQTAGEQA